MVEPTHLPIRYVKSQGVRYLRESDVYAFLETMAGSEPTDVRNRIYEAVRNMKQASER